MANDKDFKVKNGLQVGKDATFDSDVSVSGIITGVGSGLTRLKASMDSSGGAPSVSAGADSGELFFDTSQNRLEIWNGAEFLPAVEELDAFAIVRSGTFTASTGTLTYTPASTITIKRLDATLGVAPTNSADITFDILKNGTSVQQFTIPGGQTTFSSSFTTETQVTSSDTVRMDIVTINSATGHSNLTVEIFYSS